MLRSSVPRLASLSVGLSTCKFSTLQPAVTSSAEQFYAHLQNHGANFEKTLASIRAKIDPSCISKVLRRCSVDRSLLGLRFFIWAGTHSTYRHSGHMYRQACEIFWIHHNPGAILEVLESYRADECSVNLKTVKVVLNLCKEAKLADEAFWVLRRMGDFNLGADTVSYNVVIRLFCQKGDMATAGMLMREMGLVGLRPDMITFVEMIKGFCNVGELESACMLFQDMKEQGCIPNTVVFSTLLDGYCRSGSLERGLELLTEMEKGGGDCSPNVVTYTSVIQSFCNQGLVVKALAVLDRMINQGCPPNRVTVRALVDCLCAKGRLEEVDELIDKVVSCGSFSIADCNSSLIVSLIGLGKLEEAERRFIRMLSCKMRPDGMTCNMIIRELCSTGRPFDAFMLFREIEKAGCSAFIGSNAFSELLMGLTKLNHKEEAATLARLMLDRGIRLQAPYVDNVVKFLKNSEESVLIPELTKVGKPL
ncbi:pentatricopeptide repeat-containing protein At5g47360-like [Punica granatum]|uniref:Pentatricopeptide repeat-containing protein At5g47360-like n=1 Tax=Punica granatum TaxID=22663 RepID=A0A6P8DF79_PUNGR|nr:pentatricopeptide repeat-containing protein At5g47360-like [Punica granatum]